MKTLLVVDASMMVYRSIHAHPTLSSFDGLYTGGIYGCVQQLCSSIREFSPSAVVVCYDHPPYWRTADLPEYKQKKPTKEATALTAAARNLRDRGLVEKSRRTDEAGPSVRDLARYSCDRLQIFLGCMGIPFYAVEGLEADDLIACTIQEFSCEFERTIILSYDSDLYQALVDDTVFMVRKNSGIYGRQDFLEDYGIPPELWPSALCLSGSHNGVPGIKGIGPKKAVKILLGPDIVLLDYNDLFETNLKLIRLPHPNMDCGAIMPSIEMKMPLERETMRWLNVYDIQYSSFMMEAVQILAQNLRKHGMRYE